MNTNSDVLKEIGRLEAEVMSLSVDADSFVNDLLENAPDAWDDDVAGEAIARSYLRHLEAEVQRLGGCLLPWCRWGDGEYCDHGYPGGTLYRPPHEGKPSQGGIEESRALDTTEDRIALVQDAASLISQASVFVNGILVMADDKTPALRLIADMALWKDRYEEAGFQWSSPCSSVLQRPEG